MGEPAQPTAAARAKTRQLAAAIVSSVENDEPMSHGLTLHVAESRARVYMKGDVEQLVFQLAQEIVALQGEAEASRG